MNEILVKCLSEFLIFTRMFMSGQTNIHFRAVSPAYEKYGVDKNINFIPKPKEN